MHDLTDLKNQLFRELEKISSRGEINSQIMDVVYKALCAINTIMEIEEKDAPAYSGRTYRGHGMSYTDGGYSNRRDSRGRYSGGNEEVDYVTKLEEMMMSAPDERSKQDIERIITRMRGSI